MTFFRKGAGHGARSGLCRPQWHARRRRVGRRPAAPSTGIYDQISRPDEKASSNYGSLAASYRFSDAFTLSGQIGTSEGHGETPAQDVSETVTPVGTGGGYQLQWHRQRARFQLWHRRHLEPGPGRHSGRLRLDIRRPVRRRRRPGGLGPDRRGLRDRQWRLDQPEVRRALQQARARLAVCRRPGPAGPSPWTPRTIQRRSRTTRPTSTPSADRSRRTSGSGRLRNLRTYNGPGFVNRDPVYAS